MNNQYNQNPNQRMPRACKRTKETQAYDQGTNGKKPRTSRDHSMAGILQSMPQYCEPQHGAVFPSHYANPPPAHRPVQTQYHSHQGLYANVINTPRTTATYAVPEQLSQLTAMSGSRSSPRVATSMPQCHSSRYTSAPRVPNYHCCADGMHMSSSSRQVSYPKPVYVPRTTATFTNSEQIPVYTSPHMSTAEQPSTRPGQQTQTSRSYYTGSSMHNLPLPTIPSMQRYWNNYNPRPSVSSHDRLPIDGNVPQSAQHYTANRVPVAPKHTSSLLTQTDLFISNEDSLLFRTLHGKRMESERVSASIIENDEYIVTYNEKKTSQKKNSILKDIKNYSNVYKKSIICGYNRAMQELGHTIDMSRAITQDATQPGTSRDLSQLSTLWQLLAPQPQQETEKRSEQGNNNSPTNNDVPMEQEQMPLQPTGMPIPTISNQTSNQSEDYMQYASQYGPGPSGLQRQQNLDVFNNPFNNFHYPYPYFPHTFAHPPSTRLPPQSETQESNSDGAQGWNN